MERAPLLAALASGDMDLQRYTHYLRRMQLFHQALDDVLQRQMPPGYSPSGLNQRAALDRDLAALNTQAGHLPAALARSARALVSSQAAAWGVLYVLEGARLGSQVLLKRNANNHSVQQASAFIRGEADATGRLWLAFCAALESGVDPADVGTLLAAAEQTFDLLGHWLEAPHD
jgi:heme oxygenase